MESVIKSCSFENWYDKLRVKKKTVHSKIIPIPDDFLQFLLQDDFTMQESMFPEFAQIVNDAISELGGHVFAKLNFTAPIDAQWIGPQRTLELTNFEDIIYLLKGSTRVLLDLTEPFGEKVEGIKPVLVLKKYFLYRRDREFRIFQKNKNLRFISSRYSDVPCHIPQEEVEKLINDFSDYVSDIFPFEKLIFDIYISPKMKTHLVDVAPWNLATSSSMFTWEEIQNMDHCETRLCNEISIQPVEDPTVPVELLNGTPLDEIIKSMKHLEEDDEDVDIDSIVFDTE